MNNILVFNEYKTALPFPQPARFGRGVYDGNDYASSAPEYSFFSIPFSNLNGDADERHYKTISTSEIERLSAAEIEVLDLPEYKTQAMNKVKASCNVHIEATHPYFWKQANFNSGLYTDATELTQMTADIASSLVESNRVEQLIEDAVDVAAVDAAIASLSFPNFPVVLP